MPHFIDSAMSLRLQLISSELGAQFIRLFGVPVYLDGNIIDLGYYKVQIVEACSGLRYIYPLLSLSFLAAYLFKAPLWQRAVIFFSAIPLTVVMNSIRIGLVGLTVSYWGAQAAEGLFHLFEGWIIFLACAAALALEIHVLARISGKSLFEVLSFPSVTAKPQEQGAKPAIQGPLLASMLSVRSRPGGISNLGARGKYSGSPTVRCISRTGRSVARKRYFACSGDGTRRPSRRLPVL